MKIISKLEEERLYNYLSMPDPKVDVFEVTQKTGLENTVANVLCMDKTGFSFSLTHKLHHYNLARPTTAQSRGDFKTVCIPTIPFPDNYGHCLHDVIPKLLFLDKHSTYDVILFPNNKFIETLLDFLQIKFQKIKIIPKGVRFSFTFERIFIENHPAFHKRDKNKTRLIKDQIDLVSSKIISSDIDNRLIYCTRNSSSDVKHGRKMEDKNEADIISLLKDHCDKNSLLFTLFDGQENGKTMSYEKQMRFFNEAQVVVGPHGSAMANVVYMRPEIRPKVCEFTSGSEVQVHGGIFNKHYNALFGHLFDDMYDYSLIPFTAESTPAETLIDLDNLKEFLKSI